MKAIHDKIAGDFFKSSLISRIDPNSRTIHLMAMENTLASTQDQHQRRSNLGIAH